MGQMTGKAAILKRDSGINESGSSTVVVHKERLQVDSKIMHCERWKLIR